MIQVKLEDPPTITINAPIEGACYTSESLPTPDYDIDDCDPAVESKWEMNWVNQCEMELVVWAIDCAGNENKATVTFTYDAEPIASVESELGEDG